MRLLRGHSTLNANYFVSGVLLFGLLISYVLNSVLCCFNRYVSSGSEVCNLIFSWFNPEPDARREEP